ncbi:UBX domain-containing protein 11 isoform X3 [Oryctolagus cuniculus]|uniref:UBX domain-containing protein 11 isoform X3 n=1 Tax=Oryctolagus cuniculus TaxID=9986 RepID=UPI00387A549C
MSSPLASLSKTRKVPLQSEPGHPGRGWGPLLRTSSLMASCTFLPSSSCLGSQEARDKNLRRWGQRLERPLLDLGPRVVTWVSLSAEDEEDMLNDGNGSEERISVPSCYGSIGAPVARQGAVSHDSEALASVAKQLWDLERLVKAQADEMLSKAAGEAPGLALTLGLAAAGSEDTGPGGLGEDPPAAPRRGLPAAAGGAGDDVRAAAAAGRGDGGDSTVPPEVDFDRLLASLQDLSELVAEGDMQVTPVPGGARLRVLEPIPLKLYRNGIMMFDGPFRPFHDPSTQRCLRDMLDGFFPSELQRLYPNGVPFKVSDLRNQVYPENGLDPFPGEGRVVGWQKMRKASDRVEKRQDSTMTAEKFLNKLPKFVIRQGEVVDIRGPIRDTLQSCCPLPARVQEIIVETPALATERERSQETPNTPAPPLSMLRIKSENGEQAFLLMMRPEDTVGDVRTLLAQARATDATAFEIFSTFPPTVYQDDSLTLQAAGLVPNATLLLRARRAPLASPGFSPGPGPRP